MGSLSNLYISQSFQSLIKLASDTGASGTSTQLQDGLGTNIGVYVNTNGEVSASSFSGSVTGIGNVSAFSSSVNSRILAAENTGFVTTASFNSYTQSTNTFTASISTSVGLLQTFSGSEYKSDSSSFDSRLDAIDVSGYVSTGSFNAYTASQDFKNTTFATTSSVNSLSASIFSTDATQSSLINGKLDTSSFTTFSTSVDSRLDLLELSGSGFATTASVNALSASIFQTDATQSSQINGKLDTSSFNAYTASVTESVVTAVVTNNGSNYYIIDGVNQPKLSFVPGPKYRFHLSGIAGNHPFKFSTTENGPTEYTTGVTSGSNFIQIEVGYNTTTPLYYYCTNHNGMGNQINVLEIASLATTASLNTLSSSIYQTDSTQSNNIASNSSSIGLLQTFSGSQYKNDSSSFDSRILAITGSTINTGSFATTGSNTFVGNQTITGDITASGNISSSTISGIGNVTLFSSSVDSRLLAAGGQSQIQDEGTILGNVTSFNFNGAGVTATVSSGTASVTIPGGGGSIYTGSFATTGSNSFLGTQTLLQTGSWGGVLLNVQSGSIKFNGQVADSGFSGTGSIFLTPVNLPHGSTKVVFQTEYQSGSTNPNGNDYILGIGRQGDTYSKTVDLGTDSTLDVSRANLVGFNFTTTASFDVFSGSQYKNDSSSFDSRISSGAITGSSIITASVSQSTITFTKGNGTQFSITIADVSGSTFDTSSLVSTSSFNAYTQSTNTFTASISTSVGLLQTFSGSEYKGDSSSFNSRIITATINTSSFATTGSNTFVGSQWFSDAADTNSYSALSEWSGSLILSAKGYYTASFPQLTSSLAAAAGTGFVNLLFKGDSTAGNTILSGSSNILGNPVAPTATFYRQVGNGNLALLGTLPQVSASMLFPITMNGNVINGTGNPITLRGPVSSSGWTINANNIQGTLNLGSSTALHAEKLVSAVSLTVNNIPGTLSIIANQSTITGSTTILGNTIAGGVTLNLSSSAITMNNNIVNDSSCTLTNQFYSSSLGFGTLTLSRNNIAGQGNSIIVSGSQPTGTTTTAAISDNFIGGGSNIIYSDIANAAVSGVNAYHNAVRNIVFGNQLIITGSSVPADTNSFGSAFFGRYNDLTGNKDLTSQTIFAVGTGNSTTRKTGLHIDSGSNTFIEGSLNVSGSSTFTGSVATPPVVVTITSDTASIDFSKGSIYTLTLVSSSVATYVTASNLTPGQTANLVVTQASALSGSIVWASAFKFPSGSAYTGSKVVNAVDLISFITVNNTTIYSVGASNLV